ncbi:MAG: hypothetical protein IKE01_04720 [Clostridia bacterium]|nr:hypothetical protein [Clostridia bacterium]
MEESKERNNSSNNNLTEDELIEDFLKRAETVRKMFDRHDKEKNDEKSEEKKEIKDDFGER